MEDAFPIDSMNEKIIFISFCSIIFHSNNLSLKILFFLNYYNILFPLVQLI